MEKFFKYCIVGAMNTGITMVMIFLCKSMLGFNPYVSNIIGYVCGLINSFLWNKRWVFKSYNGYTREAMHFCAGFAVCYLFQLCVIWFIMHYQLGDAEYDIIGIHISRYGIATLAGAVVYTVCNFLYNRIITFRKG